MKEQHTPGPWHWEDPDGIVRWIMGPDNHGYPHAVIHHECRQGGSLDGNAKLISAAPELLEACQSVMNWQESADPLGPILAQVEKAIKKATEDEEDLGW